MSNNLQIRSTECAISKKETSPQAFTLIDLLAVIATIGILVAVLPHALAKDKTVDQKTQCAYNLKQLGLGVDLFAKDNNQTFPPAALECTNPINFNGGPLSWDCFINRYDLASGAEECIVPQVAKYFSDAQNGRLTTDTITNEAGEKLIYYLLSPAHPAVRQKHPLVIGIMGVGETVCWNDDLEAIADCDAFAVAVDRYQRDVSKWAGDAFTVYEALAKRPDIDTNRVSLYGDSVGAGVVFELLEKNSKLWHGVILFAPVHFPDPSKFRGTRIFMDNGGAEHAFLSEGMNVPMRFQDAAAKAGIPVTLLIHPGQGHTLERQADITERMREALIFLNED